VTRSHTSLFPISENINIWLEDNIWSQLVIWQFLLYRLYDINIDDGLKANKKDMIIFNSGGMEGIRSPLSMKLFQPLSSDRDHILATQYFTKHYQIWSVTIGTWKWFFVNQSVGEVSGGGGTAWLWISLYFGREEGMAIADLCPPP